MISDWTTVAGSTNNAFLGQLRLPRPSQVHRGRPHSCCGVTKVEDFHRAHFPRTVFALHASWSAIRGLGEQAIIERRSFDAVVSSWAEPAQGVEVRLTAREYQPPECEAAGRSALGRLRTL